MKAWSVKQLYAAMQNDLSQCHTGLERDMVRTIGGKEIREHAEKWSKERNLTPGEIAIAEQFGFRGV